MFHFEVNMVPMATRNTIVMPGFAGAGKGASRCGWQVAGIRHEKGAWQGKPSPSLL